MPGHNTRPMVPSLLAVGVLLIGCDVGDPVAPVETDGPSFGVVPPPPPPGKDLEGRMTGGGSVFTGSDEMRVTHGFQLHCDAADPRQNLEINWHPGAEASSRWHLEELTLAECWDDPTFDPTPPPAPFDTYRGQGLGRYNGEAGASAEWIFTDEGEPGVNDRIVFLVIRDAAGNVVLEVDNKMLTFGNHQAHKESGEGPS